VSYTLLNKKFSEECVGLCEEMGLQSISEQFTTDGGWARVCRERVPDDVIQYVKSLHRLFMQIPADYSNIQQCGSECGQRPASTERSQRRSSNHTAWAEVRPHHHWRSRSTTLAARSTENWIQSVCPGVQVSASGWTTIPRWTVLTGVWISQSWSPPFSCCMWPVTLQFCAPEQRDTATDVLLFPVQHSGTHSHCLFLSLCIVCYFCLYILKEIDAGFKWTNEWMKMNEHIDIHDADGNVDDIL